ncbi:hypothetical protein EDB85DRAFT_1050893 [Lactarius pseudohatsudake]|nr:hypothetical protein EDB85DRAFT_1050893 [Lactarius pseudohatsudake]
MTHLLLTCHVLSLSPVPLPPPSVALNLAAYTQCVCLSLLLSFHPHHSVPSYLTGSLRICVNPFVFKTHSRSPIDGTQLPLFPPVHLGNQAQRTLLHFSSYPTRRIVLSGSLFGLLGFIGFTFPEQRGVGTFRIEDFPLMFVAER